MKDDMEKKERFAWITHMFDFKQSYSLENKDKHKLVFSSLFVPLSISHLILIIVISFLSFYNAINLQISPIFQISQSLSLGLFLLFSLIPIILYVCAFSFLLYDIQEKKEGEKESIKERNHLKLILFLIVATVIIQFIIFLFFSF